MSVQNLKKPDVFSILDPFITDLIVVVASTLVLLSDGQVDRCGTVKCVWFLAHSEHFQMLSFNHFLKHSEHFLLPSKETIKCQVFATSAIRGIRFLQVHIFTAILRC